MFYKKTIKQLIEEAKSNAKIRSNNGEQINIIQFQIKGIIECLKNDRKDMNALIQEIRKLKQTKGKK